MTKATVKEKIKANQWVVCWQADNFGLTGLLQNNHIRTTDINLRIELKKVNLLQKPVFETKIIWIHSCNILHTRKVFRNFDT